MFGHSWNCLGGLRRCGLVEASIPLGGGALRFLKTESFSVSLSLSPICESRCKLSVVPAVMALLHHHGL